MANINKYGAPTKNTIGVVGQKYLDLETGTRYICTDVKEIYEKKTVDAHPHSFVATTKENFRREYIWEKVGGGTQIFCYLEDCVLPAETVSVIEPYFFGGLQGRLRLEEGKYYIVILDSNYYYCVAHRSYEYDETAVILGDVNIFGGGIKDGKGNGEPFYIESYDDGVVYLNSALEADYTISIYEGKIAEGSAICTSKQQADWNQNNSRALDYVENRTHYSELIYSNAYLNYFDVNPAEVGIGIYPLVLVKEGASFSIDSFLKTEMLQRDILENKPFSLNIALRVLSKSSNTISTMSLPSSSFLNSIEYIDETNYKKNVNPALGLTIYCIGDVGKLHNDYINMFLDNGVHPHNGVYLEVSIDQSTIAIASCVNVSFEALSFTPIDKKYIPTTFANIDKATVGQTIVVKEVDRYGKPTVWEAADAPGTGDEYDFIVKSIVGGEQDIIEKGSAALVKEMILAGKEPRVKIYVENPGIAFHNYLVTSVAYNVEDESIDCTCLYDELSSVKVEMKWFYI
jgi:hypothetical protein